jgi:hypothetical protein
MNKERVIEIAKEVFGPWLLSSVLQHADGEGKLVSFAAILRAEWVKEMGEPRAGIDKFGNYVHALDVKAEAAIPLYKLPEEK